MRENSNPKVILRPVLEILRHVAPGQPKRCDSCHKDVTDRYLVKCRPADELIAPYAEVRLCGPCLQSRLQWIKGVMHVDVKGRAL